jgi:heme-degrading monooxygenase HmoA
VSAAFTTLWEFIVRPAQQAQFERHYAPDGTWARLFRQADGYLGTELLRDRANALRYVTVDRWRSVEAYRAFRERFAEAYAALDRDCEGLTTHEAPLGEFGSAGGRADPPAGVAS